MTIQARAPDGTIVEFVDGTTQEFITTAMRNLYGGSGTPAGGAKPLPGVSAADRSLPFVGDNGALPRVPAPRSIRQIEFEGQIHEFPGDATDTEIQKELVSRPRKPATTPGLFDDLIPTSKAPATSPNFEDLVPVDRRKPVTDPALLQQLNGASAGPKPVTDPALLEQLNAPSAISSLPPGFVLDKPQQSSPPLPPGATLDKPQARAVDPATGLPPGFVIQPQSAKRDPWDQFADAPPRPKHIPVDHDPFAQFADAPPRAATEQAPSGRPRVYIGGQPPVASGSNGPSALHSLRVGAQGVFSGAKDIALAPVDMLAGLQNVIAAGINKATGANIPMATPASKMVDHVTEPYSILESEMSRGERLGYNVSRFGTQALGTGAMLATRAPAIAAAVERSPTFAGRTLDALARPYKDAPARTVIGDTIGGTGAGAAVNATHDLTGENGPIGNWNPTAKAVADVVAPLVGGVGANAVQGITEGLGGMIRNMATRTFSSAPSQIPLNPATKAPYSIPDVDRAAAKMQASVSGAPSVVARDIRENAAELTQRPITTPTAEPIVTAGGETGASIRRVLDDAPAEPFGVPKPGETPVPSSAMPTTGLLSRDPGLVTAEQKARLKDSPSFIQRDQNVKEGAAERIQGIRDPDADIGSVFRRASQARDERLASSDAVVDQRSGAVDAADRARQTEGAEFGAIANTNYKANASDRLDKTIVDDGYVPARAEKNRQFNTAPGRNEQLPADEIFETIDRIRAGASNLAPGTLPADFMRRLDALRPRRVEAEGPFGPGSAAPTHNAGGPGVALGVDLADLRKFIGPARERAQHTGNLDLADNLARLQRSVNETINQAPGYAEANANYSRFADRFRPEQNDEMARFTRKLDRAGNTDGFPNRGSTPPSETAGRFLSSPEKTQALQRVLDDAPNAAAGQAAIRNYMRSDFAMSALNPDGTVHPVRAAAWADHNAAVLAQMPALRREFDGIAQTARRGQQLSAETRSALEDARAARNATELELDRSVVGTLIQRDPRDVASKLLNGGYGAGHETDQIVALVKNDPAAKRGWKAAVSEVLADKVTGTRQVGEQPEVQFARLAKEFKDNEALLAKTFSPEEMNNLRQTHKILGYFKEAEKRSTVGSDTAEKWNIPNMIQLGARHIYGDLKGGGIIKRFKLLLEQLPTNKQSADEIVHMAWFNPDVAAYLLEHPIKGGTEPMYNVNLRRLIAADNAARQNAD